MKPKTRNILLSIPLMLSSMAIVANCIIHKGIVFCEKCWPSTCHDLSGSEMNWCTALKVADYLFIQLPTSIIHAYTLNVDAGGLLRYDQFIASSTSPQAGAIGSDDLIREATEIVKLVGSRAHVYCWVTGAMYDRDPTLAILDSEVYDGIKLHEYETAWNKLRRQDLRRILNVAAGRNLNVMLHCGGVGSCSPRGLEWIAEEYPDVKFNFAHCRPFDEILEVMHKHVNVYSDVSCSSIEDFNRICASDVSDRIMYGSDFPALLKNTSLTQSYREQMARIADLGFAENMNSAFMNFVKKELTL